MRLFKNICFLKKQFLNQNIEEKRKLQFRPVKTS